jgi:hypothetical protein
MSKYDIVLANGRVIDPETFLDAKRRSKARRSSTSRA